MAASAFGYAPEHHRRIDNLKDSHDIGALTRTKVDNGIQQRNERYDK